MLIISLRRGTTAVAVPGVIDAQLRYAAKRCYGCVLHACDINARRAKQLRFIACRAHRDAQTKTQGLALPDFCHAKGRINHAGSVHGFVRTYKAFRASGPKTLAIGF